MPDFDFDVFINKTTGEVAFLAEDISGLRIEYDESLVQRSKLRNAEDLDGLKLDDDYKDEINKKLEALPTPKKIEWDKSERKNRKTLTELEKPIYNKKNGEQKP